MAETSIRCVVLDTSFLVALTIDGRPNHEVAVRYFQYWVENGIQMYVPTIVCAEYMAHNERIPDYIMRRVKVMSFRIEDAEIAARIQRERVIVRGDEELSKVVFKDDIKIIGSACAVAAKAIAHDDPATMSRYIKNAADRIAAAKGMQSICLYDGFNRGIADLSDPDLGI